MKHVLGVLYLSAACGGGAPAPPPPTTTSTTGSLPGQPTAPVLCGSEALRTTPSATGGDLLSTWHYMTSVGNGPATLSPAGDTREVTLDGAATFSDRILGPSLVAGPDHGLCLQLTNLSQADVTLQLPAAYSVEAPTQPIGETAITSARAPSAPSVTPWLDPALERQGLLGLVVVRDPALVAAVDPLHNLNLVVFAPDPAISTVATCTGCPPTAAPSDLTLLVAQRVVQVYRPPALMHGAPPNEFLTTTASNGEVAASVGAGLWLNLFNSTDVAHTVDLGELPLGPAGAPAGAIVLAPGEGVSLAGTPTSAGTHMLRCIDCPDVDLATVMLEVVAAEEPSGGSGASTDLTYRGGSGEPA